VLAILRAQDRIGPQRTSKKTVKGCKGHPGRPHRTTKHRKFT